MSKLSRTKEHRTWRSIRFRCARPGADRARYHDRGITVCERWQSFANFLADMGYAPTPQHTIERIDNDGPYSPENCVWATWRRQARNRRTTRLVEFQGRLISAAEAAELSGIPQRRLRRRLDRGWSDYDATSRPLRSYPR